MNRITPPVILTLAVSLLFIAVFQSSIVLAQEDVTPPSLLDVQFEPEVIDTSKGPQTITVTVHITDDLSGLWGAALRFRKPGTTQELLVEFRPDGSYGVILDGDATDGYFMNTITLPQYSAYGEWEMFYVYLSDNVGNRIDLWRSENDGEAKRGSDSGWPSLFNGFNFEVAAADAPQLEPSLFIPLLHR